MACSKIASRTLDAIVGPSSECFDTFSRELSKDQTVGSSEAYAVAESRLPRGRDVVAS